MEHGLAFHTTRLSLSGRDRLLSSGVHEELEGRVPLILQAAERCQRGLRVLRDDLLVHDPGRVAVLLEHVQQQLQARPATEVQHHATTRPEHVMRPVEQSFVQAEPMDVASGLGVAAGVVVVGQVIALAQVEPVGRDLGDAGHDHVHRADFRAGGFGIRDQVPLAVQGFQTVRLAGFQVGAGEPRAERVVVAEAQARFREPLPQQNLVETGAHAHLPQVKPVEVQLMQAAQEGPAPLVGPERPGGDLDLVVRVDAVGEKVSGEQVGQLQGDGGVHGVSKLKGVEGVGGSRKQKTSCPMNIGKEVCCLNEKTILRNLVLLAKHIFPTLG